MLATNSLLDRFGYARFCLSLACSLGLAFSPAWSAEATDPAADLHFLSAMQHAAKQHDYAGMVTYTQENHTRSMRLVHVLDGKGERERLELLDGPPREYLRTNDQIQCLLPQQKLVIVEQRHTERFPAVLVGEVAPLQEYYDIHATNEQRRVAGRDCALIEVLPKDTLRYGYRFCADTQKQLLLQSETLNTQGDVIHRVAFVNIDFDEQVPIAQLQPQVDYKNWRFVEASLRHIDLAQDGWKIVPPPGFYPLSQISRSMRAGREVSQLVLTDGLAAISVFIEPVSQQGARLKADKGSRRGSMNLVRSQVGEYWVTTTGEVPMQTLREVGQNVVYQAP